MRPLGAPLGHRAMAGRETCVRKPGLERALLDKDARADGETEQPVKSVTAWRETPFLTDREWRRARFTKPELENLTIWIPGRAGNIRGEEEGANLNLPGKDVTNSRFIPVLNSGSAFTGDQSGRPQRRVGLWTSATEGAKFWLNVLAELRKRGGLSAGD